MASLGLFLTGVGTMRQARLARKMFNWRCRRKQDEMVDDSDSD
jgi:hypothetical protein